MEEKRASGRTERQIPKFVQDDQVDLDQHLSHLPCFAERFFLFQRIDQFYGREEADLAPVMLNGLDADCSGRVAFACSRPTDQDNILGRFDKLTSV